MAAHAGPLRAMEYQELAILHGHVREMMDSPGWRALTELLQDGVDKVAFLAIEQGQFDERGFGIACGYQRCILYPQVVCAVFDERDRAERERVQSKEA